MPVSISGTNGVTFPDSSLQAAAASPYTLKNKIINGDFRIDQRNAGASVSTAGSEIYTLDRWAILENGSMVFSVQQSTTIPSGAGFVNSILITTTTAASPSSSTRSQFVQYIEGFNIADLGWGTASAKTVTISFWVRSSLTGQFGGAVSNSAANRSYPFTYTISTANTWEQKTITIAGDTSGTWNTTNDRGIGLFFDLGMGSTLLGTAGAWASADYRGATGDVKLSETSGATFYITGVQLEIGTSATPFERKLYGQELANCQRYFNRFGGSTSDFAFGTGFKDATSTISLTNQMPVSLRATPSVSFGGTVYTIGGAQFLTLSSPTAIIISNNNLLIRIKATTSASITNGNTTFSFYTGGTGDYVDYSSEL